MDIATIYKQYQNHLQHNDHIWQVKSVNGLHCHARIDHPDHKHELSIQQFNHDILLSRNQYYGLETRHSSTEQFRHNLALICIIAGQNEVRFRNHTITAKAGDVWLLSGDLPYAQETLCPINGHFAAVSLDFSQLRLQQWANEGLLDTSLYSPEHQQSQIQLIARNAPNISPILFEIMRRGSATDSLFQLEQEAATLRLSAYLLRLMQPNNHNHRALSSRIDEAIDIIRAQYRNDLTIATLARQVGINECYLKRDFKAYTGETIANYIRRLRLECAMEMLAGQGKTVKETMFYVGYHHAGHFSRIFYARYGCLPRDVVKNTGRHTNPSIF